MKLQQGALKTFLAASLQACGRDRSRISPAASRMGTGGAPRGPLTIAAPAKFAQRVGALLSCVTITVQIVVDFGVPISSVTCFHFRGRQGKTHRLAPWIGRGDPLSDRSREALGPSVVCLEILRHCPVGVGGEIWILHLKMRQWNR
jgi:hypothetical protein